MKIATATDFPAPYKSLAVAPEYTDRALSYVIDSDTNNSLNTFTGPTSLLAAGTNSLIVQANTTRQHDMIRGSATCSQYNNGGSAGTMTVGLYMNNALVADGLGVTGALTSDSIASGAANARPCRIEWELVLYGTPGASCAYTGIVNIVWHALTTGLSVSNKRCSFSGNVATTSNITFDVRATMSYSNAAHVASILGPRLTKLAAA